MKRFLKLLLFALLFISISCNNTPTATLIKLNGQALGTFYTVSYYDINGIGNIQESLDSLFEVFNHVLSVYDSTSMISCFNRNKNAGTHPWFNEVYNKSNEVYKATGGLFDPTVAPLVNAWGFGFEKRALLDSAKIDSLLTITGFDKLSWQDSVLVKDDPRIMLDFNAIAKGYCSDVAAKYLQSRGVESYLVEIGGEISALGVKADNSQWKVGIEKPAEQSTDAQTVMQVIHIKDRALATSGNYRRYIEENGKRYSHTINPLTGYPSENSLLSATVIANDCITADAFATAFMVMGVEKALSFAEEQKDIEAFFIILDEEGGFKTLQTKGFDAFIEE